MKRFLAVLCALVAVSSCRRPEGDRQELHGVQECVLCHESDYVDTSNPVHEGLFDRDCRSCHTVDAWVPAVAVDHRWFALRNRHAEIACSDCHTIGYRPGDTSSECVSCHRQDYDNAMDPSHVGYSENCATCHTDAGWRPSTFDHPWPLDGAHLLISCESCHMGSPPQWAGVPRECVGCHQDDYDGSPFPGHDTFPTTCQDCHSTSAWTPATGGAHPEDRFPLRDPHDYECADCHNDSLGSPVDGMNCDCVGCHEGEHARSRVDRDHDEVGDYPRGPAPPNFCLDCHPNGRD